ncbi:MULTISPECIES: hypothetical protein [Bacillaceae]|jgi:hypothetical protein|uniref:Uncharacterized protein n=3 Tax=Anoxybacillaceae TaxID=3120669 RepID=A0A6G9J0I2_9BACL|nr:MULTISPECIES: hypothetical protein [Bacillaceae]QNU35312.1 hypothetical protein IC802_05055 [Geobacillus sp. 44C]KYD22556.1 hypothetical protein B4110_2878 [Parageobacillus toebii]MBB3869713.1 hypothetical protein [Parageobacillus toebii NBRC 107807]MED4969391.1 hypothetical protein [Parageobacillus toebii]MED4988577.1 hypothetical protein [Parageobacillus toebii]
MEKNYRKDFDYDEDAVKMVSEQIMDAYHSGVVDRDELHYNPKREVGE